LRIAIVGAGIGGLTAAIALQRDGHEVVCFEKTRELREVGAGLQLTPNATRLLRRLGLEPQLQTFAVRLTEHRLRRWQNGRVLTRRTLNPLAEERWGAPRYAAHRAELHDALRSHVPSERIRLGARCTGVDGETSDAVRLRFEDGSEHVADVVVGADGIHSTLRRGLADDAPRFGNKHTFRGLVPIERVRELWPEPRLEVWLGPGRSMATYPVSAGRLVNFAGVFPATEERPESWTSEGSVEDVLASYAGWHEDALSLIAAADKVLVLPLYDRAPMERWSSGRLTLLGDAAHPMFPYMAQGAVQAIEDAAFLARCLRGKDESEVVAALRTYETGRLGRTARIQQGAAGNDAFIHMPDGEAQERRDANFVSNPVPDASADWLWGYDAELDGPWDPARP
jgi:salicylate hydroxylase